MWQQLKRIYIPWTVNVQNPCNYPYSPAIVVQPSVNVHNRRFPTYAVTCIFSTMYSTLCVLRMFLHFTRGSWKGVTSHVNGKYVKYFLLRKFDFYFHFLRSKFIKSGHIWPKLLRFSLCSYSTPSRTNPNPACRENLHAILYPRLKNYAVCIPAEVFQNFLALTQTQTNISKFLKENPRWPPPGFWFRSTWDLGLYVVVQLC